MQRSNLEAGGDESSISPGLNLQGAAKLPQPLPRNIQSDTAAGRSRQFPLFLQGNALPVILDLNNTGQMFKVTTSSVDLKPNLGHEVKLARHKASGAVSTGAADNSFAATELNTVSEHCCGGRLRRPSVQRNDPVLPMAPGTPGHFPRDTAEPGARNPPGAVASR